MKIDYTKKKIDWNVYIERKNMVFYICIACKAYGKLLKKSAGIGLQYQIHYYKHGNNIFYISKKDYSKVKKYFLDLIKNNPKKINSLHKKCLEYLRKEKEIISLFSKNVESEYVIRNYGKIMNLLYGIFTYLTGASMMILDAIDMESTDKRVKKAAEMFLPLRSTSRNILQPTVLRRIWTVAAEVSGNKDYLDFSLYTPAELGECLNKGKCLPKEVIKKRKNGCAFYEDADTDKIIFHYNKNFLSQVGIKAEIIKKQNEITGVIACKGLARGRVYIINTPIDINKFKEGGIVVSTSTKPSMVPVLTKCGGIVTDEGGLSCHAAIISRELNKPCVIGTKIATKILHDGDLVEVDANKGIVKILKNANT